MRQQLDTLLIVLAICASSAFATKCIFCPAGPTPYTPITNLTNCNETNCTKCEITWLKDNQTVFSRSCADNNETLGTTCKKYDGPYSSNNSQICTKVCAFDNCNTNGSFTFTSSFTLMLILAIVAFLRMDPRQL